MLSPELENRLNVSITYQEHKELIEKLLIKFKYINHYKFNSHAIFRSVIESLARGANAIDIINQLINIIDNQTNTIMEHYIKSENLLKINVHDTNNQL